MNSNIVAAVSTVLTLSVLPIPDMEAPPASRTWLQRPWEIRYILFADEAGTRKAKGTAAREFNAKQKAPGKKRIHLSAAALFEPTVMFLAPEGEKIAVVLLAFDRTGRVLNQRGALGKMSAKRNLLDSLVLINDEIPGARPYYFADCSQGIPGDVTFSPAVCSSHDIRRYEAGWNINSYTGNFGCREWTAQLYDRHQPYIDITSWSPRGSFIGELVGWSRFEDPPKPVIGRHGKTWLCLHECPAGEKTGVIPDIKAWTARHGYPMPQRPPKQPLYPNADYMDDLKE